MTTTLQCLLHGVGVNPLSDSRIHVRKSATNTTKLLARNLQKLFDPQNLSPQLLWYPTHANSSYGGRAFHRLCVCLFFFTISQKPMQLGSSNLTYKCSTMSPGNSFLLWLKGHESHAGVGLCTLVSAGFRLLLLFCHCLDTVTVTGS